MDKQILRIPEGTKDIFGLNIKKKREVEKKLIESFEEYGFDEVSLPSFEFFDVFSDERGTTPSKDMFKFVDREGETLVLRPDMTPQVARCVAKYYAEETNPIKICYLGNTFVNNSGFRGKLKESTQIGAELFNASCAKDDALMIEMMIKALLDAGAKKLQVEIGMASFYKALVKEACLDEEESAKLKELISNKNLFAVESLLSNKAIPEGLKDLFLQLSKVFGNFSKVAALMNKTDNIEALKAFERLESLHSELEAKGLEKYITYDLGMLSNFDYYTGIIFRAYTEGSGEPIAAGGRYDSLLSQFGKESPAIGVAVYVDSLLSALEKNEQEEAKNNSDYLIVALAKGRLANQTMEMFKKIGIECEEIFDKTTRKLIFVNEEKKMKFFLAKASDVPTYVEYGAADLGVVGLDTILEEGRQLYEVMDLNLGKCRMCVAGPESARELLQHGELIRVATKYPNIAKDYFVNVKHQTVELIKLNGSVELAPIVSLAQVIVDIVETGSTLRENGLKVLEEICNLSARMVVNQVSLKLKADKINELIDNMREVLREQQ